MRRWGSLERSSLTSLTSGLAESAAKRALECRARRWFSVYSNVAARCSLRYWRRRCRAALMSILGGKVLEGSTIYSDVWKAYDGLILNGYDHYRVYHSKNESARGKLIAFFALELPFISNRSPLSTEAFDNVFLNLLQDIGRVCRWATNTKQAERFIASWLFLSGKTIHQISSCDDIKKLEGWK